MGKPTNYRLNIGDSEDIARRKQLAIVALNGLNKIWIRGDHVREALRIKLYKTLVKPILLYNSSTWGIKRVEESSLNAFHRQQLRQIIGKKYPHRISNQNLYKRCSERPVSIDIKESRWRLFGHILRLHPETPAFKAMLFYFEPTSGPKFRGRPRTTIVTTLNQDIERTKSLNPMFPINKLTCITDILEITNIAADQARWKILCKEICTTEAEET